MSRYIDADALRIDFYDEIACSGDEYVYGYVSQYQIDNAPSIDIVRCKECKHCHYEQEDDIYHCYKLFHRFYDTEHYCSYGEKETDHE